MVETKLNTLTYEDYLKTPDDERWELLNGELIMVASPNTAHQRIAGNLYWFLVAFVRERGLGEVFISPFDVVLSHTNVLQPDVLYSEHGVGEYWLVDPYACTVSVMVLQENAFQELSIYGAEDILTSPALPGFSLDLRDIFQSS